MLFECWMMNTAWLTFPQHEVKFYLSLYCTSVLYNCALQCPSLWLNLIWIYDILYYCTVLSLLSHFLAMSFYHPGYIVASWWCVTLGYCIITVAGLGGWPWRPVDPTMMFPMLISLILMCHTWLLHHHSGRPWRLTVEASGPHHDVSHVNIIGFDVSHLDIASSWWPALEADRGGQWTPPLCFPCWYLWF